MPCRYSLYQTQVLAILSAAALLTTACRTALQVLPSARYNQYIYDDEGIFLSFWNDSLSLYFQPGDICPEIFRATSPKKSQTGKRGPGFRGSKLIAAFEYKTLDPATLTPHCRNLTVIKYRSKISTGLGKSSIMFNSKGLSIYQTSANSYSFEDTNDNHYGLIIDKPPVTREDTFAITALLNGFTTDRNSFILDYDNWYERADAKALDTIEGHQTYLKLLFYLSKNYHWATGNHDVSNEMFTTKICDVASRLHNMNFIRQHLKNFNWLEFDRHKKSDKGKVEKLRNFIQRSLKDTVSTSAITQVLNAISNERLVMINENHFDWRHRYFTELLLDGLKKQGFDMIGFETLGYDDSLNDRKFANYYSGYYSRESQMSNVIREAERRGFHLFSYEDTISDTDTPFTDSIYFNSRELMQAVNVANIVAKYPERKIVIHAGFGHVNENGYRFGRKIALAEILQRNYGINPFTINQTYLDDLTVPIEISEVSKTSFFVLDKSKLVDIDPFRFSQCDMYVYNNIKFAPGENIVSEDIGKIEVEIPKAFIDSVLQRSHLQSTLELYLQEEYNNRFVIPYYVKHVTPLGTSLPTFLSYDKSSIPNTLFLPEGKYVLVLRAQTGEVLYKDVIKAGIK